MKKSLIIIALACAMVFAFAATAMADHSPQFYFDFQAGNGVTTSPTFLAVFPSTWSVSFAINNGSFGDGLNEQHSNYSQTTAKCGTCHAVHRAPTAGTSGIAVGPGVSSSRYSGSAWTAEATTQLLLKSSANDACIYCHVTNTHAPTVMFGGDANFNGATGIMGSNPDLSWNAFYGHTTGCTSCHSVHGAQTFQGAAAMDILKWKGVKAVGAANLVVQPEVYNSAKGLYSSQANMIAGTLNAAPAAAGVSVLQAAATAQCTICHASYAYDDKAVNTTYTNMELFQPGSWASANGSIATFTVAQWQATPAPGIIYTGSPLAAATLVMSYKNHPMKAADAVFAPADGGASNLAATAGAVANAATWTCQSCHNSPSVSGGDALVDGRFYISQYPHITPGYYKFMKAQNQAAFDTPSTQPQLMMGPKAYFASVAGGVGKPAIMNDGYCTKCHDTVGSAY
jgi:hypothetical protein